MRAFAFSLENQMNVFFKVLKPCLNPSVKRETKKKLVNPCHLWSSLPKEGIYE